MTDPYNQTPTFRGPGDSLAPADWPVLLAQQNVPVVLNVTFQPNASFDPDTHVTPSSSSGSPSDINYFVDIAVDDGSVVKLIICDHPTSTSKQTVSGVNVSDTAQQAVFRFNLTAQDLATPGLFLADVVVYSSNGSIVTVKRCYLEVEQNNTDTTLANFPLTTGEIRLALRDQTPAVNYLLDDVEFTNREIQYAIHRVVDLWNETPPPVARYTYASFPYRYWWTEGTIAHLLRIAAANLRRNRLQYNAGGVAVDPEARADEYEQLAGAMLSRFEGWMKSKKIELNIDGAYGMLTSGFPYG